LWIVLVSRPHRKHLFALFYIYAGQNYIIYICVCVYRYSAAGFVLPYIISIVGQPLLDLKTMPNARLCACDVFCVEWLIIYYFMCRVPRTCNGFGIATTFSLFYTMVNRHSHLRRCVRIIKRWIRDDRNRVATVVTGREKV